MPEIRGNSLSRVGIMPPQLVALTEGPNILLDKPILLIGRHQECDIQIQSRKVSRRHCCIAQVNDHLVVRDLCSTNGIRVNGVRVLEGSLKSGDELTIGNFRYEVRWHAQPGEAVLPGAPAEVKPANPQPPAAAKDPLESFDQPVPLADSGGQAVGQGLAVPGGPDNPADPAYLVPKNRSSKEMNLPSPPPAG